MCYRSVPKNVDHTFQLQPCGVQGILYINARCDIVYTASYGIYKVACVIGVPTAAIEIAPMDCLSKRLLLPLEGQERHFRSVAKAMHLSGRGGACTMTCSTRRGDRLQNVPTEEKTHSARHDAYIFQSRLMNEPQRRSFHSTTTRSTTRVILLRVNAPFLRVCPPPAAGRVRSPVTTASTHSAYSVDVDVIGITSIVRVVAMPLL